jgi:hypothetical protein
VLIAPLSKRDCGCSSTDHAKLVEMLGTVVDAAMQDFADKALAFRIIEKVERATVPNFARGRKKVRV